MAKSKRGSNRYTISIPKELENNMLKACKEREITTSHLIREGISIYLELWLGDKQKRKDDPKV